MRGLTFAVEVEGLALAVTHLEEMRRRPVGAQFKTVGWECGRIVDGSPGRMGCPRLAGSVVIAGTSDQRFGDFEVEGRRCKATLMQYEGV